MTITIRNDFHHTTVTLRAERGQELSLAQILRARRTLCGIAGCTCGGNLGERGPQEVEIEAIGLDAQGRTRVKLS